MPQTSAGGDLVLRERGLRGRLSDRVRKKSRGLPACQADADCDDGDACTDDACGGGACVNTPIPDCVPCRPVRDDGGVPIDVVFVMDTSGSMKDEAAALCRTIEQVVIDLRRAGVVVNATILGITETPTGTFECLTDSVASLWPGDVLDAGTGCAFPEGASSFESWGPATAVIARNFRWFTGATRIIVPIADEGPCNGSLPDGCNDPGDDRDAIEYAISVAGENNVIVSPITGTGTDACVTALADEVAKRTCGLAFHTQDPRTELADAIVAIILESCATNYTCDDNDSCTRDDLCVDGVCLGTPIEGCVPCDASGLCSDGDACTDDVCVDSECVSSPNYDVEVYCCNPNDGGLAPIDDGSACTNDACDPDTGGVDHTPLDAGIPCDDGNACTAEDACDGAGKCVGTDINTLPCTTDADCFGSVCGTATGYCMCSNVTELCLSAVADGTSGELCYQAGQELIVDVELGQGMSHVVAGQFLIGYDPWVLRFVDVVPGSQATSRSPFVETQPVRVDDIGGRIFYVVGVPIGDPGTPGPAVMARLRFLTIAECTADSLCFLNENVMSTKLTDVRGMNVPYVPCCTGDLIIRGEPVTLSCPESVAVNADPGEMTAEVTWNPVAASGGCVRDVQITCDATHSGGADIDALIEGGGRFPAGRSMFTCTAPDECGDVASCSWSVEVHRFNALEVSLQLSPTIVAGPLQRCIEFELFSNCVEGPVIVQETVEFGLPFNLPGFAKHVQLKVPPGKYKCVAARDPLHTVRSVADMEIVGDTFKATFKGDPFFGGNWLVGGNLNGDRVIDILDFGIYVARSGWRGDPATPCGTPGPNADINGDGVVDALDFSFIQNNLGTGDKGACCPGGSGAGSAGLILEISLDELELMGLGYLGRADVNGDGLLNAEDLSAYMMGRRRSNRLHLPGKPDTLRP